MTVRSFLATLSLLAAALPAPAETLLRQDFTALSWSAGGAGPLEVAGTPWRLRAFDVHDDKMVYRCGKEGLVLERGIPWGLPGAYLTYTGPRGDETRTITSLLELSAGAGGNDGRETWLAAFTASPEGQSRHLVLSFDSAGTNGAQTKQGGPGGYAFQTLPGGLKLVSAQGLIPGPMITGHAPACEPADFILLSPQEPPFGHLLEAALSYDRATGRVAARVRDLSDDLTLYEGRFTLKPCADRLWPSLGGYNGYASWASDKAFRLRVERVELDDAFRAMGPALTSPGLRPEDPLARVPAFPPAPCLRDFAGAVNWPGGGLWHELGVGWGRADFSWSGIEPRRGEFHFSDTDHLVLAAQLAGESVLPMLGYTAPWALPAGSKPLAAPDRVADWEEFVEAVVAHYSRPPFNLRYFQVWNEPTLKAGFWQGRSDEEFFERIYLPAAKIIRRYDCQVVFGGWPCSDGVDALSRLLDRYEAWRWTDILDLHYYELPEMVKLYDRYVKTGKCRGVWQTEVGFHPYEEYLPNLYCRALFWGLRQGWSFPDKFKLFWYAFWGNGPDGINCLTRPAAGGNEPTPTQGLRMRALNQVLGDGRLAAYEAYQTNPSLPFTVNEEVESSEGFCCGPKVVVAFQVSPQTQTAHPQLQVRLKLPAAPRTVTLWDSVGRKRPLACSFEAGVASVTVPVGEMKALIARNWGRTTRYVIGYVVAE